MKKIYTIIVLALCVVSCKVSDPSPKTVQWRDLRDYSINKMGRMRRHASGSIGDSNWPGQIS